MANNLPMLVSAKDKETGKDTKRALNLKDAGDASLFSKVLKKCILNLKSTTLKAEKRHLDGIKAGKCRPKKT